VAPGFLLGRLLARALLTMQDMDPASFAVPWWTYTAVLVLGLFLAPLLALIPITRASRTTVREAIDHHGAGTGEVRTDNWVSRVRGLDRTLLMGLRNMFRRRARFVLLVGLLTAAGALFLGGANTLAGLYEFQDQAAASKPGTPRSTSPGSPTRARSRTPSPRCPEWPTSKHGRWCPQR